MVVAGSVGHHQKNRDGTNPRDEVGSGGGFGTYLRRCLDTPPKVDEQLIFF